MKSLRRFFKKLLNLHLLFFICFFMTIFYCNNYFYYINSIFDLQISDQNFYYEIEYYSKTDILEHGLIIRSSSNKEVYISEENILKFKKDNCKFFFLILLNEAIKGKNLYLNFDLYLREMKLLDAYKRIILLKTIKNIEFFDWIIKNPKDIIIRLYQNIIWNKKEEIKNDISDFVKDMIVYLKTNKCFYFTGTDENIIIAGSSKFNKKLYLGNINEYFFNNLFKNNDGEEINIIKGYTENNLINFYLNNSTFTFVLPCEFKSYLLKSKIPIEIKNENDFNNFNLEKYQIKNDFDNFVIYIANFLRSPSYFYYKKINLNSMKNQTKQFLFFTITLKNSLLKRIIYRIPNKDVCNFENLIK